MINAAMASGHLRAGERLLDAGSGSTAVAEAQAAAALGVPFTAVLPDSASAERVRLIRLCGGEVVFTPAADGVRGAMAKAEALEHDGYGHYLRQFDNPANPDAHRRGTAREIARRMPGGRVDAVVCGGGTMYGTWTGLRDLGLDAIPVIARPVRDGRFSDRVPGWPTGWGSPPPPTCPVSKWRPWTSGTCTSRWNGCTGTASRSAPVRG